MAGSNRSHKRKQTDQPVNTTTKKPTLTTPPPTTTTITNVDNNIVTSAAVKPSAIIHTSSSDSSSSSDSDNSSSLPPAAATAAVNSSPSPDSDDDDSSSASDQVRKLLEPFSKEQLLDFIVEAAVKDSSLYQQIKDTADSDVTHRKLFVHGLCWNTTRENLVEAFGSYGEIEDINLVLDKNTGKVKGFAFITFKTRKGAAKALREPRKKILSRVTACQLASIGTVASQQNQDTSGRKIYVSNVQQDIDGDKLRSYFAKFGEIETGPLGFDINTGKSRGFALFLYKTEDGARKAIVEPYKIFDGHQLHCQMAAEGKSKSSAAVAVQPKQTPVLTAMAATQNMMLNQHPSLNPMYGRLLGSPTAGFFASAMNPLMMAGAFNPAMIQPNPVGVNGAMALGAYGMMPPSMLPNYSPNPATLGLPHVYPTSQTGQVPVHNNGQSTSVRGNAPAATFSSYLRKS